MSSGEATKSFRWVRWAARSFACIAVASLLGLGLGLWRLNERFPNTKLAKEGIEEIGNAVTFVPGRVVVDPPAMGSFDSRRWCRAELPALLAESIRSDSWEELLGALRLGMRDDPMGFPFELLGVEGVGEWSSSLLLMALEFCPPVEAAELAEALLPRLDDPGLAVAVVSHLMSTASADPEAAFRLAPAAIATEDPGRCLQALALGLTANSGVDSLGRFATEFRSVEGSVSAISSAVSMLSADSLREAFRFIETYVAPGDVELRSELVLAAAPVALARGSGSALEKRLLTFEADELNNAAWFELSLLFAEANPPLSERFLDRISDATERVRALELLGSIRNGSATAPGTPSDFAPRVSEPAGIEGLALPPG
jgi:hypothetical protein